MIMYAVKPDSVRMGLSDSNIIVALFMIESHARKWASSLYEEFYRIERVEIDFSQNSTLPFFHPDND